LLIDIFRWRIPKENGKKQLDGWREVMDYQRSHPEKFHYTRSRFFTLTEEGSGEENWMYIDEYEDREAYDKMMKAFAEDLELVKLKKEWKPKWDPLIVPGSKKGEVWIEVEKLRVELRQ